MFHRVAYLSESLISWR